MPLDKSNELNSFLVSVIVVIGSLFVATIGIIYNLMWKNIKDLWMHIYDNEKRTQKNAVEIAGTNARCKERGQNKKGE